MKKNLISIIILALLIVNIVLTAIMMFSVTGASKKTSALVDNIATALDLELAASGEGEAAEEAVSMADTETYSFAEQMQVDRLFGAAISTTVSFPLRFRSTQRLTDIRSTAPRKVWRRWKV